MANFWIKQWTLGLVLAVIMTCQCYAKHLDIGVDSDVTVITDRSSERTHLDNLVSDQCLQIRENFESSHAGPASIVPKQKLHDGEMEICYDGRRHVNHRTCCTRHMELKYQQAALRHLYDVIQSSSSYLKSMLQMNARHYHDTFLGLIQTAENMTEAVLEKTYQIPVNQRHGPVAALYTNLRAYVTSQVAVNIHDSVTEFFDELFPLVFQNTISDLSSTPLDEDYMLCLRRIRQDLSRQPFGEDPTRLAHSLSKSLGTARDFLRALELGLHTINTTDKVELDERCSKALTRLEFCGQCQREQARVRPCKAYCQDVMHICLASFIDLDTTWSRYITELERLTDNMWGSYNIEEVMRTAHSRVSEAIMHAMETGPRFYPKIVSECGKPESREKKQTKKKKDGGSGKTQRPGKHNPSIPPTWDSRQPDLYTKIDMFMRNLVSSKGFYAQLPDTACTDERFSSGLELDQCWNGQTVARYNKSTFSLPVPATPLAVEVAKKKLITITQELSEKAMNEMEMQSDQRWTDKRQKDYDYWGSGDGRRGGGRGGGRYGAFPVDDEEYYYQWDSSGSGSGDGSYEDENPPYRTGPENPKKPKAKPVDSEFEFTEEKESPYRTQKPAFEQGLTGGVCAIFSHCHLFASMILSLILWLNG